MKKITSFEEFDHLEEAAKYPTKASTKVKSGFTISGGLKKVSKIQKTLIDLTQMLTEMSDEIMALKMNFTNLDPESMTILTNMKYNIDNMVTALKRERKGGANTGVIDNSERLQRNLVKLKKDFLSKRGVQ